MPEERSVRDRLAEVLYICETGMDWLTEGPHESGRERWRRDADVLLETLATAGFQLVPLSPHQAGDSER